MLLAEGEDVNWNDMIALHFAAYTGHCDVIRSS